MTPEEAIEFLVGVLATQAEPTEADVYASMESVGIPRKIADRAFQFAQVAWGRIFLEGLGVKFAPDFIYLNKFGDEMESGKLAEEPYFAAATAASQRDGPSQGMIRVGMMSADVQAINNALNAGSQPEDLVTGPVILFTEQPTQAGMVEAQRLLNSRLKPAVTKPWWKFW